MERKKFLKNIVLSALSFSLLADTSNNDDHVFKGSIANELAAVSGDSQHGYTLQHTIYVKA